ncbi:HSF-type DNA-binding-domain-containing protein [Elsinoe ampelina]|uniref:HSF-type DNA-binding-domain-containing protein n=1 Tax=Elsinoe ampelina TaxID=302913 RepID=A0A6A6GFZ7_9PEZI|nr:HSF-type DNA-binding-domain-containing protein [Elsinoe ampelina]
MTSVTEAHRSSPFDSDRLTAGHTRDLPLLSSNVGPSNSHSAQSSAEPMDISPHSGPSSKERTLNGSPSRERLAPSSANTPDKEQSNNAPGPVGAAAAAQQPKVVQAAFIHKLYNMLEDQTIQHLISWSNTNESFVMSPSTEFSKVLASYFKHTNISSFVRQLNMYGFHKVSDVFHAGSPDSPLWEFKHGAGSFKRGDLVGLREIKRRASRQTLIHRDSFSNAPKAPPQHTHIPAPQPELPVTQESLETRVNMMEYNFHEVFTRLARTDDALHKMTANFAVLSESLSKCVQYSNDISSHLLSAVPDPENPVHRDVAALKAEIARHAETLKSMENQGRPAYGNSSFEPMGPISPRHPNHDNSRRPSLQVTGPPPSFRTPMAPVLASPRRQGSLSVPDGGLSPSAPRAAQYNNLPPPPVPQPQPHPLATVHSPPANLSRRHTSADIRVQGWHGNAPPGAGLPGSSPFASGQNSTQWPSSPYRPPQGDQHLRDVLASYELSKAPGGGPFQRHTTPPPDANAPPSYANVGNEAGWQLPGPKFPFRNIDFSAPPTRRSSMASNVHSLLNPAETAEREGEEEPPEERKRKRVI